MLVQMVPLEPHALPQLPARAVRVRSHQAPTHLGVLIRRSGCLLLRASVLRIRSLAIPPWTPRPEATGPRECSTRLTQTEEVEEEGYGGLVAPTTLFGQISNTDLRYGTRGTA